MYDADQIVSSVNVLITLQPEQFFDAPVRRRNPRMQAHSAHLSITSGAVSEILLRGTGYKSDETVGSGRCVCLVRPDALTEEMDDADFDITMAALPAELQEVIRQESAKHLAVMV